MKRYFKTPDLQKKYFEIFGEKSFDDEIIYMFFLTDPQFDEEGGIFVKNCSKETRMRFVRNDANQLVKKNFEYPKFIEFEYISSKNFLHGHFLEEHGPGPSFRILNSIPNGLITLNGRISEILFSTPLKVLQEKKEIILSREIFPIPEFLNIVQLVGLFYIDIIE